MNDFNVQRYLDAKARTRRLARGAILWLIKHFALRPPAFVSQREMYGVHFEGMTLARWSPWLRMPRYRTALSPDRLYMIKQLLALAPAGPCYELGVFRGGVTRMLLDHGREVFAFDTFAGISGAGRNDLHRDGEYAEGLPDVAEYIRGATVIPGRLPYTLIDRRERPAFVHIDLDVYEPTLGCLRQIWPWLRPGAIVVLDDYGVWTTPGVRRAADEFNGPRRLYLPTGQLVLFKD